MAPPRRTTGDTTPTGADAIESVEPAAAPEEVQPASEMSGSEIKDALLVREDAKLHPAGEPKTATEKEPGGPPATDPQRPPFATNRPDTAILTSLATGSGGHTPPDPDTVDADGYVRPLKAEEK